MTFRPMPELIYGGMWSLRDTSKTKEASVDIDGKVFNVPFGSDPQSIALRRHEYFHVKWSPPNYILRDLTEGSIQHKMAIQSLEDLRVNRKGELQGLDVLASLPSHNLAEIKRRARNNVYDMACIYLASYGYHGSENLKNYIRHQFESYDGVIPELDRMEKAVIDNPDFETVKEMAARTHNAF